MTVKLILENDTDSLDLNSVYETGTGVQATSGATGFGLPQVNVRWMDGVADGSVYRGRRVLSRDIDLPLYVVGTDRQDLKVWLDRLALMLNGKCTLRLLDGNYGPTWITDVYRVGGGDYVYGADTVGETEFRTVVTFRAPDPYWTASSTFAPLGGETFTMFAEETAPADDGSITETAGSDLSGLLPNLTALHLAHEKSITEMTATNPGNAPAYPLWTVTGPADTFEATLSSGETIRWEGTLGDGEQLFIDTKTGLVTDGDGTNRYSELAAGPHLWLLPPGVTTFTAALTGTNIMSKIDLKFVPRRLLVI